MKQCVTKSFKSAISPFKPGAFVPVSVQDFGKCITNKYELTVMSRLQRLNLTLRHEASPFFFNRFIRLLQQNMFKNLIRLPSVRLHLKTVLHSKLFSSDDQRPNPRNTSTNAHSDPYQMLLYTNILHPDTHLQSPLRQASSIVTRIEKRLFKWQPSMDLPIGYGLSAMRALFSDFPMPTVVSPEVGPASPDLGKSGSNRTRIRPVPLLFRLISGRTPKHPGFSNRVLQNGFTNNFKVPRSGAIPDMHLMRGNGHLRVKKSLPTITTNTARYIPDQEIEEKILKRLFSTLTHLTLQPLRYWPNRLIDTDEIGAPRTLGLADEKTPNASPALIDKRTRHFVDNASRKNSEISQRMPPKMKLAVSEKKTVPDFKEEFQNIERQLKKIKSSENTPSDSNIDIHHISERVYDEIERKLRIERERRGL